MKIVIVGGGSAGLWAAHRLADLADVTLVEAGIDPGHPTPPQFLHEHAYPDNDWDYTDAETGRHLVRGKVLGGSSTVNASAGVRGGPLGFDALGPGWTWNDLLPALKTIETDDQFGGADYHGNDGPVHITRLEPGPLDIVFETAALDAGYPSCPDHNALGQLGVGPWPTNRVDGGRWGTLPAVAPLVRDRITLRSQETVEKVLFAGNRATGVQLASGEVIEADEVIVSAGAYGTPELLWRSGVEIPGIGENLQDHPWVMMNVRADPEAIMARPVSGGLLRAGLAGDDTDELQIFPFSEWLYNREADPGSYCVSVSIMQPFSRGYVRRGERGTEIALKHLSDERDLTRMLEAVGVAADLIDRMAAAGAVTVPEDAWWKGPDVATALKQRVETYNHPVGTCAIGPVVDERLRVNGYERLRIIDASVMPKIIQANTNLATMAIGWRAAGFVADDLAAGSTIEGLAAGSAVEGLAAGSVAGDL
jgi:choline dehydrogenase